MKAHHDPAFPRLHGRPDSGWVNDPNGLSHVDGRYHVFFQHNPRAPRPGDIVWGHASSTDLLHWRQDGVALVSRPGELDAYGCWSGCVVDDAGVPTAVYSAVADDSHRAQVLLARSDRRMLTWRQEHTAAAGLPDDAAVSHARDPFVFHLDGHRYAVQGAGHTDGGRARILVYGCDDLTAWTELGTLLSVDDPVAAEVASANIWECPNLVRFGDRWVLVVSLWRNENPDSPLAGVRYLVGDLTVGAQGPRFTPTAGGFLDHGPCFYAPQMFQVAARTLMWAWSWERDRSDADIEAAGWAGALTFCRELSLTGDTLVSRPAIELDGLRRAALAPDAAIAEPAFEVALPDAAGSATLWLVDGADERLVARLDVPDRPVTSARILVDGSMVEVFDGSGTAWTTRAYPTVTSHWVLRSAGPVQAWRLGLPPGP